MKVQTSLFSLGLLMTLATVYGNRTNQSNAQEKTVVVDILCSSDLTLHELKGHVQNCSTLTYDATLNNDEYTKTPQVLVFTEQGYLKSNGIYDLTYDEQGKLTKGINVTDNRMEISIKRDKNGYITSLTCEDKKELDNVWAYHIDYKWNNKKQLIEKQLQGWENASVNQYKYDEMGLRRELKTKDSCIGEEEEYTSTYTYTKFDNRGNWTERNVQIVLVTSTFDSENDTIQKGTPQESYVIQKRKITYFQ